MADCERILATNIEADCDLKPIAGLEVDMVIVNQADIDQTATTIDATNDLLCTNFQLQTGKTGILFQGIKLTSGNTGNFEMIKDDYGQWYSHKIGGVLYNMSVENRDALYDLVSGGGKYVAVVNRKWKGEDSEDAFMIVGGLTVGMIGTVHTWGSSENNGTELFELMTEEGSGVAKPALNLLETDYSTTLTAFESYFAQA